VLASPALAQGLPVGTTRFEIADTDQFPGLPVRGQIGAVGTPMPVFVHRPPAWTPADRILIVMHGTNRDADRYMAEWTGQAERGNVLVVVPEFSQAKFPRRENYNFGSVVLADFTVRPREAWTFDVIDRVFAAVKARSGATRDTYVFYGHSAGAQFVHRYLLLASASKAEMIVSANSGSYTMPTAEVAFPFGLGGVPVGRDDLARAFARPVVILLGDQDIDPNHSSLPRDPPAMAQGPHRLARGHAFFSAAEAAAKRLEVPFNWRLIEVPGVGHSNGGMADAALRAMAGGVAR
jgi:poly(3-hydroxybutyrate) depolymerase